MPRCEVCGNEVSNKRFCSTTCKNISQTREWQIIQTLLSIGSINLMQLHQLVGEYYGIKKESAVEAKIAKIMRLLKEIRRVEIRV